MNSPLDSIALFYLGPVPITQAIVTTWVIMVVLVAGAFLLTRKLELTPTKRQAALELIVTTLDIQIVETSGADPTPLPRLYRDAVHVHSRGELVLADPGG
jgi:F-type H+-transporting ATPase subunit a